MMHPIDSSMLSEIGWADDTLFVRFQPSKKQVMGELPGDLWKYKDYVHGIPNPAPEEGWGKWFLANIRGKYTGEKVDETPALPAPTAENAGPVAEEW